MATKYDWDCDECGFHNAPNANRRGPAAQLTCEQCGYDCSSADVLERIKTELEARNA